MVRFWNKDLKRFFFMMIMIALMGGVLCNLALSQYAKMDAKEEYAILAGVAEAVSEKYPEVPEEEVIRSIAGNSQSQKGKELLAQYGILEKGAPTRNLQRNRTLLFWMINGCFLVTFLFGAALFLWFWKRRNKKIGELSRYVDRISLGDETLDIRNNQEDELSGLKNELYKLMTAMREKAGSEKEGKEALTKELENISHQLKTPLTSAVVLADNILEDDDMDPTVRKRFVQEISRQLIGMKWLVVTLLKLSRLDAGVATLAKDPVPVKRALETAIQNLEMKAEWKQIQFVQKLSDGEIIGDEKWLVECFQNVIKNALEFSPQGGKVEVELEDNDVFAQVVVRDHGPGIPEEARKHLFERFYTTSKVENDNAGIGLALSKEIVEKHNGYVTVNSGEEGTEFVMKFLKNFK